MERIARDVPTLQLRRDRPTRASHVARPSNVCLPRLSEGLQRADGTGFNELQYPTDIVLLAVLWRLRYKLGFGEVAELLLPRGYEVTHETIRQVLPGTCAVTEESRAGRGGGAPTSEDRADVTGGP